MIRNMIHQDVAGHIGLFIVAIRVSNKNNYSQNYFGKQYYM
jgi:hypothetical protein